MVPDEADGTSLCSKQFKRYTFDNVFKYEYVGTAMAKHGGVKVVYKDRLSRTGTHFDAEWAPVEEKKDVNGRTVNATTEDGILFVMRPPDLRRDAPREAYSEKGRELPLQSCTTILKHWPGNELGVTGVSSWQAFKELHSTSQLHSGMLPTMPYKSKASPSLDAFTGTPMELKPILQKMMRRPRPLITWDPFLDAPPPNFPLTPAADPATQPVHTPGENAERRDPRTVNTVTHGAYSTGAFNKITTDLNNEEWLERQDNRLDATHWVDRGEGGGLYMVLLKEEDADGEFRLGLGRDLGPGDQQGTRKLRWFQRCNKRHEWLSSVKFKLYGSEDDLEHESFLLQIDEDKKSGDVTPSSSKDGPYLDSKCMLRLRLFAGRDTSLQGPAAAPTAARPKGRPTPKRARQQGDGGVDSDEAADSSEHEKSDDAVGKSDCEADAPSTSDQSDSSDSEHQAQTQTAKHSKRAAKPKASIQKPKQGTRPKPATAGGLTDGRGRAGEIRHGRGRGRGRGRGSKL